MGTASSANMLSALKADIQYHRLIIGVVFGIVFITIVGNIIFNVFDIHMILGISCLSFYIGMLIIGVTDDNEKRDRYQVALPITIAEHSTVRLLFCILFQAGITMMWLILFLVKYTADTDPLLWDLLSYNALNIIIIMLFVIFADLGHLGTKVYRLMFLILVLSVFFFLIYLSIIEVLQYPLNFGPQTRKSPWEALLYSVVCMGLVYCDHMVFLKRKSYLR